MKKTFSLIKAIHNYWFAFIICFFTIATTYAQQGVEKNPVKANIKDRLAIPIERVKPTIISNIVDVKLSSFSISNDNLQTEKINDPDQVMNCNITAAYINTVVVASTPAVISGCIGASITLEGIYSGNCSGGCSATNSGLWYQSSSSGGPWTLVTNAGSLNVTPTSIPVYYYFVFTCGGSSATSSVTEILGTTGPANDDYANASNLTVNGGAIAGTTSCGSLESNESTGCNSYSSEHSYTPDESVWYSFIASASTNYVQINLTGGCYSTFGASIWDPVLVASSGSYSYQIAGNPYCGAISCQGMYGNTAGTFPLLFELCHLTPGNVYYIQIIDSHASCGAAANFNIAVSSSNPGGTITNPCTFTGQTSNYLTSPIAECYINGCTTSPSCPSCTTYTISSGGTNESNIVFNSYYSFTTATGCSNDLQFQQCMTSTCGAGNVNWLTYQLYSASGQYCITSGDLSTGLTLPGVGCSTSYILQYTGELSNCKYYDYTPFTDNYGSSSCVLPIELIRFTANENEQSNVDLSWTTATETNNDYFTIERSIDGKTFTNLGKVKGAGNSTYIVNYNFTDETAAELPQKTLYYRLTQTDKNGSANSFNIIDVNMSKNFSVSVYPNPSTGDFNLDFSSQVGTLIKVELTDATGAMLNSKLYIGSGGLQHQKIEPSQPGIYILNITINGQVTHKKIVKL